MLGPEQSSSELEDTIPDNWMFRVVIDAGSSASRFIKVMGEQLPPNKPTSLTKPLFVVIRREPRQVQFSFVNLPKMTRSEALGASLQEVNRLLQVGELSHPRVVEAAMLSVADIAMTRIEDEVLAVGDKQKPLPWRDTTEQVNQWFVDSSSDSA